MIEMNVEFTIGYVFLHFVTTVIAFKRLKSHGEFEIFSFLCGAVWPVYWFSSFALWTGSIIFDMCFSKDLEERDE